MAHPLEPGAGAIPVCRSIDAAIKAVFEDGREDECERHLKWPNGPGLDGALGRAFIARKKAAIDDKCSYNHQGFYNSVEELGQAGWRLTGVARANNVRCRVSSGSSKIIFST